MIRKVKEKDWHKHVNTLTKVTLTVGRRGKISDYPCTRVGTVQCASDLHNFIKNTQLYLHKMII